MRKVPAALLLALVGVAIPFASQVADAQVSCYLKKCAEYPDGSSICSYTPIVCEKV